MANIKSTGEEVRVRVRFKRADGPEPGLYACLRKDGVSALYWAYEIVFPDTKEYYDCPSAVLPRGVMDVGVTMKCYRRRDVLPLTIPGAKQAAKEHGLQLYVLCADGTALDVPDFESPSKELQYAILVEDWLKASGWERAGGCTVDKISGKDADALKAYKATGLKPEEIQEVVDMFKSEIDKNVPAEVKDWMERCVWHCHKCAELDAKNRQLEKELTRIKLDETKKLKESISENLHAEQKDFVTLLMQINKDGVDPVETVMRSTVVISQNDLIVKAFDRTDLQYLQLKALAEANTCVGLLNSMVMNLPQRCDSVGYSWNDAKDAIFKTVAYCERLIEEGIKKQKVT